jgi:hypothetical protein
LSIANPNFSEIAFTVGYLHNVGSLEVSFQGTDELYACLETLMICTVKSSNYAPLSARSVSSLDEFFTKHEQDEVAN